MKSLVAALILALALPVYAQPELEEAPGASDLPPPPAAPSTSDLNEAVDQLSNEQKSAPTPKHQMPAGSPVKHGRPFARHEKPKKEKREKKKAKKEKAAKKAAKSDKKKKKKKH